MTRLNTHKIPCKLVYPDQTIDLKPSPSEIYDAVCIAMRSENPTVLIERDERHYMRCLYREGQGHRMRVQDGNHLRHFYSASNKLSPDEAAGLLISYTAGDTRWESMIRWKPYTSVSLLSPFKKRKGRSPLIEKQGKWIFISPHWVFIGLGLLCYAATLLVFLTFKNSPTPVSNILNARSFIASGTTFLILSLFVDD
ncbi:MAG: hypothetical protein R3C45_16315 [Phycisphaerales bacterium]